LVSRPKSGEASDGIELLEIHQTAHSLVVIAAHEDVSERLRLGNHLVRVASVTDGVAEIDDDVVDGSGSETRVQRFEVTVNVA
jgi:hypothetical protein